MSVAVVIPFAGACPHRARALWWVLEQYDRHHPEWEIVIGEHDGPWCKALAVANGLRHTDADTLVIADADVWCDDLTRAVDQCTTWAVPHHQVHRLDGPATDQLLADGSPGAGRTQRPYPGHPGGGIVVIRREAYESCPIDPRFVGWGQEDDSWAHALRTLHGRPWRGTADLIHLWHPPQQRITRTIGSHDGRRLLHRYRAATRNPAQMRQLIAEHTATAAV